MAELKSALNEATEEYGKLETKAKADEVQHQLDISALNSVIEELKTELRHANHLLNALKQENVQIAVEKICPSVSKNRHSISSVYSMYVNANEDYEQLSVEHEQLKHQFSRVVDEIKDKAPQIQRTQIELTKLKEENEEMQAFCDSLKIDRLMSQEKINGLLQEVTKLSQKVKELQQEKTLMSHQVCELLSSIEGKKNDENKKSDFSTFRNIEELQQNNVQLVNLVRELTASIEELEKKKDLKIDESQNLKSSKIESQSAKIDGQISKTENSMPNQQNESNLAQSYSDSLKEKIKIQQTQIESLNNQLTSLKTQLTEVQSLNFKLKSQLEHSDGQLKLQQKNFEMMKKKMQTVDEKNQNSMTTIAKLETTLVHLREQLRDTTMKLTKTENSLASINYENKTLVRSEAQNRAKIETQEKQSKINGHLITNLEFIRSSIERIENSGSALKLKEKCEELEQQLEEEKNKLKDFESQANAEIEQLECETQLMQDEISKLKEICEKKSTEIEKLSEKIAKFKKIGESEQSDSSESDTEVARLKENVQKLRKVGKQYRQECFELRSQLEEAKVKNEELQNSKAKEESMRNLLTKAKSMITKLNEEKDQLKQKLKAETSEFLSCESQDITLTDLNVSFARDEIPRTSTKKRARSDDGDDDDVIILECSEKKIKSEEIKEVGNIEIKEFYGCKYPMME
ncbi:hypothetical protein PVAND_017147 [Polypedilum vanderplanki]|nr:hypothetical protein PVAND_017147 [Polypedilum vanderplanki]